MRHETLTFASKHIYHAKKRSIIQTACAEVNGFSELYHKLQRKVSLTGKSQSTSINYARHLAKAAIHFNALPTALDEEQVNAYLYYLQQTHKSASDSYFKFTVYGFRFMYRMEGLEDQYLQLPSIKREKKLPVVLSREETRRLLAAPKLLKHRVLFGLLYGCGLRCFEARNIQLPDIDFDRKMLHVRQGKGKKDRYVPIGRALCQWLNDYIAVKSNNVWLFNGRPNGRAGGDFDARYSQRGIQWVVKHAAKQAGIVKNVSAHTLRHSFATHLLEDGLDIVSIKELLGHSRIETTLIYLHVAHYDRVKTYSPLDTLYSGVVSGRAVRSTMIPHAIELPSPPMRLNPVLDSENAAAQTPCDCVAQWVCCNKTFTIYCETTPTEQLP
jgi:integrase/recombinase XerD